VRAGRVEAAWSCAPRQGGGAVFSVELPPRDRHHCGVSERVILVADDDDGILLLVTTRLRRDGHDVVQASRGDAALTLDREVKKPFSPSELSQRVHALLDE
jgi:hypothetical protein